MQMDLTIYSNALRQPGCIWIWTYFRLFHRTTSTKKRVKSKPNTKCYYPKESKLKQFLRAISSKESKVKFAMQ